MEKLGVKKSCVLACTLAVLLSTLLIPVAQANACARVPPTTIGGDWTYSITEYNVIKQVGSNTFVSAKEDGTWTGTFVGTSKMVVSGVWDSNGFLTFHGLIYFDGSVRGIDGTLVIRYSGILTPTGELTGHWVILHGKSGLANLRGQGTLSGVGIDLHYSGLIHFERVRNHEIKEQ